MPVTIDTVLELTDAIVKTKYEANADTNAFTDAEKARLAALLAAYIEVAATPSNYTPTDTTVEGHLEGIDSALMSATAGAPASDEQLSVTAASISVVGISVTSSVVLHYRNGILQNSTEYTVTANTITPSAGTGPYVAENLFTIFWP